MYSICLRIHSHGVYYVVGVWRRVESRRALRLRGAARDRALFVCWQANSTQQWTSCSVRVWTSSALDVYRASTVCSLFRAIVLSHWLNLVQVVLERSFFSSTRIDATTVLCEKCCFVPIYVPSLAEYIFASENNTFAAVPEGKVLFLFLFM